MVDCLDRDDQLLGDLPAGLVPILTALSGLVILDSWPTAVSVTDAMHHGGPWPAMTAPAFGPIGSTSTRDGCDR
jgi:NADP-dependent aldehyde dehydrogenase